MIEPKTLEEVRINTERNVKTLSKIIQKDDDNYYRIVFNGVQNIEHLCRTSETFIEMMIGESFDNRLAGKIIRDSIPFVVRNGDVLFKTEDGAKKSVQHIIDLVCERYEAGEI